MARCLERVEVELALAPKFDIRVVNDSLERVVAELNEQIVCSKRRGP